MKRTGELEVQRFADFHKSNAPVVSLKSLIFWSANGIFKSKSFLLEQSNTMFLLFRLNIKSKKSDFHRTRGQTEAPSHPPLDPACTHCSYLQVLRQDPAVRGTLQLEAVLAPAHQLPDAGKMGGFGRVSF